MQPFFYVGEEIFKDVTDDIVPEVKEIYQVTSYGRVYNKVLRRFLSPWVGTGGYMYVNIARLYGNTQYALHKLILCVFTNMPIYTSMEPNHIDKDPSNNGIWNLEWTDHRENLNYAKNYNPVFTLTKSTGENSYHKNMNNNEAAMIGEMLEKQIPCVEIIKIMKKINPQIELSTIYNIKCGSVWYIESGAREYTFLNKTIARFFGKQKLEIIYSLLDQGLEDPYLILQQVGYNYDSNSILSIYLRKLLHYIDKIKYEKSKGVNLLNYIPNK